jgi:hypothetical protein
MQTLHELHQAWVQKNQSRESEVKWAACLRCGCHGSSKECGHAPLANGCELNDQSICPCCTKLADVARFTRDMEMISKIPEPLDHRRWQADILMYQKLKELGYTEGCAIYRSLKQ